MADLVALSPAAGLLPLSIGGVTLSEPPIAPITWVAPFKGREAQVSDAFDEAGLEFPAPNRTTGDGALRAVWAGPGQALVIGDPIAPEGAATADQSDGWARLRLEGDGVPDVLARLTPVDMRRDVFAVGHAARTLLFHMTATIMRVDEACWEILVFRSMAASAVHDLERAMRMVAARG